MVNGAINPVLEEERTSGNHLNRILQDGAIYLSASVDIPVEEQRIMWTTYANLKLCFDTFGIRIRRAWLQSLC